MHRRCLWRLAAAGLAAAIVGQAAVAGPAWRLSTEGFGPFKVGMSFAQVQKLAPRLRPTADDLLASPGCDYLPLPGHPGVALMFIDDELTRIDIFRSGLRTTRGVGVGDPVARIMRTYPGLASEPRAYLREERTLTARSGASAIRFETRQGRIDSVSAGRWAQVQYIETCL